MSGYFGVVRKLFGLYAIGLMVCGAAVVVNFHGSFSAEEPRWGWPVFVVGTGLYMLLFNAFGFAVLVRCCQKARPLQYAFVVAGLSGAISGSLTIWLVYQSLPYLYLLLSIFGQAPLVVVIINWLSNRFIQLWRS